MKEFSPSRYTESVYQVIHKVIDPLSRADAIAFLETIVDHCEAMIGGLKEEMKDQVSD